MTVTDNEQASSSPAPSGDRQPILSARGLVKTFGRVVGLDGVDVDLYPGEVLAIIGDNGAGKSTLIKCLTGAVVPDAGEIKVDGEVVHFTRPQDARLAGIETVYQTLAVAPALDIASNLYLAREERRAGPLGSVLRMLDKKGMRERAGAAVKTSASPRSRTWSRPSRPSRAASDKRSRSPAQPPSAARWWCSTSRRPRWASRSPAWCCG